MDPFAYETYRQQRIAKKVEDERGSRIGLVRKLPKVKGGGGGGLDGRSPPARCAAYVHAHSNPRRPAREMQLLASRVCKHV